MTVTAGVPADERGVGEDLAEVTPVSVADTAHLVRSPCEGDDVGAVGVVRDTGLVAIRPRDAMTSPSEATCAKRGRRSFESRPSTVSASRPVLTRAAAMMPAASRLSTRSAFRPVATPVAFVDERLLGVAAGAGRDQADDVADRRR